MEVFFVITEEQLKTKLLIIYPMVKEPKYFLRVYIWGVVVNFESTFLTTQVAFLQDCPHI